MYYYFQFHNISFDSQVILHCSIIFNVVTNFIRQKYHVSTPENTVKNRMMLDEVQLLVKNKSVPFSRQKMFPACDFRVALYDADIREQRFVLCVP